LMPPAHGDFATTNNAAFKGRKTERKTYFAPTLKSTESATEIGSCASAD